eukprot:TCONS_00053185-protein
MSLDTKVSIKHRIHGIIGLVLSILCFFFANCLVKLVYIKNPDIPISGYQIVFIRSIVQLVLVAIQMFREPIHPLGGFKWNKQKLLLLIVTGVSNITNQIFICESTRHISPGAFQIILSTAPIFGLVFELVVLKERFYLMRFQFGMITVVGVIIALYPEFKTQESVVGIIYGFIATIMYAVFCVGVRTSHLLRIENSVILNIFYPSWIGAVSTPLLILIDPSAVTILDGLPLTYWLVLIIAGLLYYLNFAGFIFGMKYNSPFVSMVIIDCFPVILAYIYMVVVDKYDSHASSLVVGMLLIFFGCFAMTLSSVFEIKTWKELHNNVFRKNSL